MLPVGLHANQTNRLHTDDFADPYLELVHLLTQAAGLEHSLMAAYLYASFSIKERYDDVRGDVDDRSFGLHRLAGHLDDDLFRPHTLLDVAIEEMQHLGTVNDFRRMLGAAPVMTPHAYPLSADIYPFAIQLEPLTRPVAASFLWIEAEGGKFGDGPDAEPEDFQREVREALAQLPNPIDRQPINHLGSIYRAIVRVAERVAENPPDLIDEMTDWPQWLAKMDWILGQGEVAHYHFFRSIFTGEAFAPDDPNSVWSDPAGAAYPSLPLQAGSAWEYSTPRIADDDARRLAWLGNLHYWLILGLLDRSYRSVSKVGRYQAVGQMTRALWQLGRSLAFEYHVGFPFDPLGPSYQFGGDQRLALRVLIRLVEEIQLHEQSAKLPRDYSTAATAALLAELRDEADAFA